MIEIKRTPYGIVVDAPTESFVLGIEDQITARDACTLGAVVESMILQLVREADLDSDGMHIVDEKDV